MEAEVIIIGAGVAGLVAARDLRAAGWRPLVLEARARLGGRIWTHAAGDRAIELGAEFIHGRPRALWSELEAAGLGAEEVEEGRHIFEAGTIRPFSEFWDIVEKIDGQIRPQPEITYADFLREALGTEFEKRAAKSYVEGFNAARADRISTLAVAVIDQATEENEGGTAFRPLGGYAGLVDWLAEAQDVRLETVVTRVCCHAGGVEVQAGEEVFRAGRVLITVPLGVLKAGVIEFEPPLPAWKLDAIGRLEMGCAARVTMEFSEPFWLGDDFRGGFLLGGQGAFPVWWTHGSHALVGWAGGPPAEALAGLDETQLKAAAVASLSQTFRWDQAEILGRLRGIHYHDWTKDPFARGAYSYPGLGGLAAADRLAEPIDGQLFFAGEATDARGHNGTVHAALESGQRAAREILASRV